MEERHLDIMKIEDSIRELHDMFIDLADIVDQQVCCLFLQIFKF